MAEHTITQLPNDAVTAAIRAHHDELSTQLRERTAALLAAARSGDPTAALERLHSWYRTELIPHATAEERTLYAAGADLETTRLLIQGMLAEHQALIGLIAQLALAQDPFDVVAAATSAQNLFTVHLAKENDLLLPALDHAGVALAPLLEGMHELLGEHSESSTEPADGGCGCGCGHGDVAGSVAVSFIDTASTSDGAELDVRTLPHSQRHEIIFGKLDALDIGPVPDDRERPRPETTALPERGHVAGPVRLDLPRGRSAAVADRNHPCTLTGVPSTGSPLGSPASTTTSTDSDEVGR